MKDALAISLLAVIVASYAVIRVGVCEAKVARLTVQFSDVLKAVLGLVKGPKS